MNIKDIFNLIIFLINFVFVNGQKHITPPPPSGPGPGAPPTNSIDTYVLWLIGVALLIIINQPKKIKNIYVQNKKKPNKVNACNNIS